MPHLRRMPSFGARCAELRVDDAETARSWRVAVRIDVDAVVLVEIFEKRTQQTPKAVVERVAARLRAYDRGE